MAKKGLSAHQFKDMYAGMGYDLSALGCIMLNLEPLEFKVNESALYYAADKAHKWVDGMVADTKCHVTLLYGLLQKGQSMKQLVDTVLPADKLPKEVTIDHIDFFDSPYEDEPYYCIVAHLEITPVLQEAHDRLTFLPHIETFPSPYKAHMTLCYIKKNATTRDSLIKSLTTHYKGKTIKALDLNYGGDKAEAK